nr:hypothetical protein [Acidithiobacillus ferriphilus]
MTSKTSHLTALMGETAETAETGVTALKPVTLSMAWMVPTSL